MDTITVPFHGSALYVVNHNGELYTPMKPIVKGMGMGMGMEWMVRAGRSRNSALLSCW
ncbi:hypothetical protein NUKP71_49640 [Klebsiella quasipneumoniae]|nr:hypothetical protein NUKP71_49640 [Klebsiella quasipneumoniae]